MDEKTKKRQREIRKKIGERIGHIIHDKGYNPSEVAKGIRWAQSSLSDIILGKSSVDAEGLQLIAEFVNMPISCFFPDLDKSGKTEDCEYVSTVRVGEYDVIQYKRKSA